jgi:hypothetical protein
MTTVTPIKQKLKIFRGATFEKIEFWYTKADESSPRVAVDFTGCVARMHCREKIDSPIPFLTLTTENGGVELGPLGRIRRFVSATQTSAITQSGGVFDLEIEFPSGFVARRFYGSVSVDGEVTR